MSSRIINNKQAIGRTDKIDFPLFNLLAVGCKVDTGAFTSSIDCESVFEENSVLHFTILGHSFTTKDFHKARIKNSSGSSEDRYVIQSKVILFGKECDIQLTLANRGEMKFPVLLGRRFLAKSHLVVDVNRTDLSYRSSRRRTK